MLVGYPEAVLKRSRHLDPIALVFAMGIAATWSLPASAGFTKGPYLQDVSQTSIVVCWESASSEAGEVRFGTTASLGSTVTEGSATLVHQVEVTGLDPSTIYSYQVSSGGALSNLATLHTAPLEEEPFRFVVVGDTRTDGDAHQRVIDRVVNTLGYPDLYFNTGDLVEDGGDIGQWGEFFTIESALLAYSPLFPVAGNHDDYANDSIYAELFHLPTASSGTEGYYAFTYGNTRFIIVDTNDDFTNASTQYQWLEAELIAANANPAIRHEIVLFHDPPYTSGAHGAFDVEDWGPPRNHLVPLFTTHGVDVVFNGHDHHYERTDPALTGGVLYVVAGGGGAPGAPEDFVDGIDGIISYLGMDPGETVGEYLEDHPLVWEAIKVFNQAEDYEGGWWRAEAEVVKHFVLVEVQGGLLDATVYDVDGGVLDTWQVGTYDGDEVDDDGDGYTEQEGDCDDANDAVNPDAVDECDGVDNDCDGADEGCPEDTDADTDTDGTVTGKGCGCGVGGSASAGLLLFPVLALLRRRRSSSTPG